MNNFHIPACLSPMVIQAIAALEYYGISKAESEKHIAEMMSKGVGSVCDIVEKVRKNLSK